MVVSGGGLGGVPPKRRSRRSQSAFRPRATRGLPRHGALGSPRAIGAPLAGDRVHMPRRLLFMLLAAALLCACGRGGDAPQTRSGPRSCDDGGSGGVVIDGVCL